MRTVCLFALVAIVCGCTSNVEDLGAEGGDGDGVDVDVETSGLEPSGVFPGSVTLPPGALDPKPFPIPPEDFSLPPLVSRLSVLPRSQATCLTGRPLTGPAEGGLVDYWVRAFRPVRSIEFFRNDVEIGRIDWPSSPQLGSLFEIPLETFTSPSATVRYSIVATDTDGRRGSVEEVYHVAPRTVVSVTGAVTMRGPSSGAGVRIASIPWIGDNVGSLVVWAVSGRGVGERVTSPHFDPWGRRSGVAEVALSFTAAEWNSWVADGQRVGLYAITPQIASGCSTSSNQVLAPAAIVATTAPPSSGGGTPPGSSGNGGTPPGTGTPPWMPSSCSWVCNWADHPDKVIVDYQQTTTGCGATPYSTGTQYRMCSLSGAPAGAETSICSGQTTPGGWSVQRTETRFDVCVPSVGSGTGNTQVIRKL